MILIISKHVDEFVNQVIDCLDCDYIRIGDNDNFQIDDFQIDNDNFKFSLSHNFKNIDFTKITSIWYNGVINPHFNDIHSNTNYKYVANSFFLFNKINSLGRIYGEYEISKINMLFEAKKVGLKIPNTLITESKSDLIVFKNNNFNDIICKRITDDLFVKYGKYTYDLNETFIVSNELLEKLPSKFGLSLFQERIKTEFEIRVVFLKDNFYSMSIHSMNDEVDYRVNFDNPGKIRFNTYKLPKSIEDKLRKMFKNVELNFGSVDLIYSNNTFFFLELNKTGQISFLNEACNYNLEFEVAKILKNEKTS